LNHRFLEWGERLDAGVRAETHDYQFRGWADWLSKILKKFFLKGPTPAIEMKDWDVVMGVAWASVWPGCPDSTILQIAR